MLESPTSRIRKIRRIALPHQVVSCREISLLGQLSKFFYLPPQEQQPEGAAATAKTPLSKGGKASAEPVSRPLSRSARSLCTSMGLPVSVCVCAVFYYGCRWSHVRTFARVCVCPRSPLTKQQAARSSCPSDRTQFARDTDRSRQHTSLQSSSFCSSAFSISTSRRRVWAPN